MEIADVFVINKADRPGADQTRRDLEQMLDLSALDHDQWRPPIIPVVATSADGIAEFWEAINAHRAHVEATGQLEARRNFRRREELRDIVTERLRERARDVCTGERWDELTEAVLERRIDPWTAADEMLDPVQA